MQNIVLITGAAGSIGSEITRQIVRNCSAKKVILNDISEYGLFQLLNSLERFPQVSDGNVDIEVILGDISDPHINQNINQLSLIYHTAAYKHVGLSMSNPNAYYKNNILATKSIIELGNSMGAQIIHVSTDKAVFPCNHMGYSKRLCEFLYLTQENTNNFRIVRFGNVLNSAGSVIPIFKEQISLGGPVTVTDKHATRYLMSISDAVGLVLNCHKCLPEHTINILDMGPPQSIDNLAKNLIEQEGFSVTYEDPREGEVCIKYIGLRNGEKLHETLSYTDLKPTGVDNINYSKEQLKINEDQLDELLNAIWRSEFNWLEKINWETGELSS